VSASAFAQLLVVFWKELKDSSRDRRAIVAVVLGVLVGPAVIAFVVDRVADRQRRVEEVRIPVTGQAHAPALVDWLRSQWRVSVVSGPADPERAIREGTEDVVLVISTEFAERFRHSRAADVRLVSDSSREAAQPKVNRVRELLTRYGSEIAGLRLIAHGVSPQVVTTLRVDDVDVATPQQRAAPVLNLLGLFMLLSSLSGGMQLATDSTAGERERGSLEPLLVNPVARGAIAGGKWLAASVASLVAVALTMGFCIVLLKHVLAPDIGIRLALGPRQLLTMLVAALSICPLSAAIQATVGLYSRSFKEAQSYMGILMTLPVLAIGVVSAIYPLRSALWMYGVPLLSQYMLVTRVIAGELPGPAAFALTTVVSLAMTALLLGIMARLLRSERIVFGR
jgi:sodium transport system permease protein